MIRHFVIIDRLTLCRNRNHDLGSRGYRGEKCCLTADKVIGSWLDNLHSWQPNPLHPLVPRGCALNVGVNSSSQSHRNTNRCFYSFKVKASVILVAKAVSIHQDTALEPPGFSFCSGHCAQLRCQERASAHLGDSQQRTSSTQRGSSLALCVQSCALQQPCCSPGVYQCQGKRTDWRRIDSGPCMFSKQSQDGQLWQPSHRATAPRLSLAVGEEQQSLYTCVSTGGKNTHSSTHSTHSTGGNMQPENYPAGNNRTPDTGFVQSRLKQGICMHRREQRDMLSQHESGSREYNMHLKGGCLFSCL